MLMTLTFVSGAGLADILGPCITDGYCESEKCTDVDLFVVKRLKKKKEKEQASNPFLKMSEQFGLVSRFACVCALISTDVFMVAISQSA